MKEDAKEIIDALSSGPVQQYLLEHENQDIKELILENRVLFSIPARRLSEQIAARRKAKDKLPQYYSTSGIIYPPSENLEQSSSQATAVYKSELMARTISRQQPMCADLTGGFGVDTYFFSKKMKQVWYVEPQESLLEIARHDHRLLGAKNIEYHASTAEEFLLTTQLDFDFIFLDPSRRPGSGKKVSSLVDSNPDVLGLKAAIFEKTHWLLVKASPLMDIQAGIAQLATVRRVLVISNDNECKELLFLCERNFNGLPSIEAVNISKDQSTQTFKFSFPEERALNITFSDPLNFLYEPNASILKAGAFKSVADRYNLKKIASNTHLYTSAGLVESFPGRRFEIEAFVKPDAATEIKNHFPEGKANITTRNYPLTPEGIKKKTKLKDGGEKFLIGFSGQRKKFLAVAKRL